MRKHFITLAVAVPFITLMTGCGSTVFYGEPSNLGIVDGKFASDHPNVGLLEIEGNDVYRQAVQCDAEEINYGTLAVGQLTDDKNTVIWSEGIDEEWDSRTQSLIKSDSTVILVDPDEATDDGREYQAAESRIKETQKIFEELGCELPTQLKR